MAGSSAIQHNGAIYLIALALTMAIIVTIVGPGMFGDVTLIDWYGSWQKQAFSLLCHQLPDRSFFVNGVPMVVCSRCFGIYSGFALALVVLPFLPMRNITTNHLKWVILAMTGLNLMDVALNAIGIWENTLTSRFLVGGLLGSSVAIVLGTKH